MSNFRKTFERYLNCSNIEDQIKILKPEEDEKVFTDDKKVYKLDLHGLTLDEARLELNNFIDKHYNLGHRYLRIIHGIGHHSSKEPVLPDLVKEVLDGSIKVSSYKNSKAVDGGSGSKEVKLKAKRI